MGMMIGIDLGTTNSAVAVMEGGEPTIISTAEGGRLCPSVVGFNKNGERLIGQVARRLAWRSLDARTHDRRPQGGQRGQPYGAYPATD